MSFKSPNRTWKHVLIWLALIALLLACGLVAVWFVWLENSRERVRAAQQALRDAGAPMTVEELRGPPVADEDNAAPLLREAQALLEGTPLGQEFEFYEADESLEFTGDWNLFTDVQRNRIAAFLAQEDTQKVIDLLHQAAAKPALDFGRDASLGLEMLIPERKLYSRGVDILMLDSQRCSYDAQQTSDPVEKQALVDRAFGNLLIIYQITNQLVEENNVTTIIDLLVSIALFRLTTDGWYTISQYHPTPIKYIDELSDTFASTDVQATWVAAIDGERIGMGDYVFETTGGESVIVKELSLYIDAKIGGEEIITPILEFLSPLLLPLANDQQAAYVEHFAIIRAINVSSASSRHLLFEAEERIFRNSGFTNSIINIMTPSMSRVAKLTSAQIASSELLLTGLVINAYADEHGALPESLSVLVPEYMDEVPVDPFDPDGGTYRYQVEGEAFRLYSIGEDEEDDGGAHNIDYADEGDIVFRGQRATWDEIEDEW